MSKTNELHRLDTDLLSLRALVAIADEGSFSAAAQRIGRTQSAVSLQIARLEDRLQTRLLERTSRRVTSTPAGELLIAHARRILEIADEAAMAITAPEAAEPFRIGFAQYLAPQHLHDLLSRFCRAHPKLVFELRLGTSHELREAFDAGDLDVMIALAGSDDATVLMEEPMVWTAALDWRPDPDQPLPLVVMQAPCIYRQTMLTSLAAAERPWRIVMEANSIQGVQSAVRAGLGLSAMARSAVTEDMQVCGDGLPALPVAAVGASVGQPPHPLAARFLGFLEDGLKACAGRAGPPVRPGRSNSPQLAEARTSSTG